MSLTVQPFDHCKPAVRHLPMLGHVSVDRNYSRTQMAECGQYVYVREMAPHVDAVTCPKCRARIDAREAMTFAP